MAIMFEMNEPAFREWVESRPSVVQDLVRRYPPNVLYRMKTSGNRGTIVAYAEDGTVRVRVRPEYNLLDFPREVFGVHPSDLEECEPPAPDEIVGIIGEATCEFRELDS